MFGPVIGHMMLGMRVIVIIFGYMFIGCVPGSWAFCPLPARLLLPRCPPPRPVGSIGLRAGLEPGMGEVPDRR
ncbi:hypothetical protein DQ353_15075 [Arthrobacter sp. AQ5-05]|nr:hypothetical protein DQ353_15075 [Arthrobacter sp. AQ5-05]